jgi:hypothetical protein
VPSAAGDGARAQYLRRCLRGDAACHRLGRAAHLSSHLVRGMRGMPGLLAYDKMTVPGSVIVGHQQRAICRGPVGDHSRLARQQQARLGPAAQLRACGGEVVLMARWLPSPPPVEFNLHLIFSFGYVLHLGSGSPPRLTRPERTDRLPDTAPPCTHTTRIVWASSCTASHRTGCYCYCRHRLRHRSSARQTCCSCPVKSRSQPRTLPC